MAVIDGNEKFVLAPPKVITRTMTIAELIQECQEATHKMGTNNPHRVLLINCAGALQQLCDRLVAANVPGDNPGGK